MNTETMSLEIYPVIHVESALQALEQSSMAYEADADGIYLIDHLHTSTEELIRSFTAVEAVYPDKFIGLNFLQLGSSCTSFEFVADLVGHDEIRRLPNGIWSDDATIMREDTVTLRNGQPALQEVKYLGGVAFKYTPSYTEDSLEAAQQASDLSGYIDVVTTSGSGTGQAANLQKIISMKAAIAPQRLAIASGVDAKNLASYHGHVDEVLVSTSIETEPNSGIFEPNKLKSLIDLAHKK